MELEKAIKLKALQIEMLQITIDICEKYNLKYFLLGGSCLGAVRHKGIIPWDDDIDVGMPREDYNRFCLISANELKYPFFLQNHLTDPEYISNFSKMRNSATTFIEKGLKNMNINHGVYIDIFPLDGYSKSLKYKLLVDSQLRLIGRRVSKSFYRDEKQKLTIKQKLASLVASLLYFDIKKAIVKKEELIQLYKYYDSEYMINHCGAWSWKEISPRKWFDEGVLMEFEGVIVNIPQEYDKYLTRLYGDYMTPPPLDQQVGHHVCTVIDLEKSYISYTR